MRLSDKCVSCHFRRKWKKKRFLQVKVRLGQEKERRCKEKVRLSHEKARLNKGKVRLGLYMENAKNEVRKIRVSFRCTEEESRQLEQWVREFGYSNLSEYIRRKLFPDTEKNRIFDIRVLEAVKEIEFNNLKIGVNINQIAKVCNSRPGVYRKDIENLKKEVNLIQYNFQSLEKKLLEIQGQMMGG